MLVACIVAPAAASAQPDPAAAITSQIPPAVIARLDQFEARIIALERLVAQHQPSAPPSGTAGQGAISPPAPDAAAQASPPRFTPGWEIELRAVSNGRVSDVVLGNLSITDHAVTLGVHQARGVRTATTPAYRATALFTAQRAGAYTFQSVLEHPGPDPRSGWVPACIAEFWISDESNKTRLSLPKTAGPLSVDGVLTVTLPRGYHRVGATVACVDPPTSDRSRSADSNRETQFSLRVRTPDDQIPRTIRAGEIVHPTPQP